MALEFLEPLVREAGEIIREGFYKAKEIHYKSSVDLVTRYDVAVEEFLLPRLQALYPDYQLVGEESTHEIPTTGRLIYIDPIDGTTNFVHSVPHVAISIGVWDEGQGIEGIVYNPILDELYYGQKGCGALFNGNPLRVSATSNLQDSLMATGFPYTKVLRGEDYRWVIAMIEKILPATRDVRRLGSASIDLCMVARGTFDGYYEINLKPWDVAGGIVILQEAGGRVSALSNLYTMNERVIVASNGAIHQQLVDLLLNPSQHDE